MITKKYLERCCTSDELSVMLRLKKLIRNSGSNTVVICSVDRLAALTERIKIFKWWQDKEKRMVPTTAPDSPFALLGQEGWECLDPFVPVEVPAYSDKELNTMIHHFRDRGYISEAATTDAGREEIR